MILAPPPYEPVPPIQPVAPHFAPEVIGSEVGGLGRDPTWLPSNALVPMATAQFSPAVRAHFANRKIERPSRMPADWEGRETPATFDVQTARPRLWRGTEQMSPGDMGRWTPANLVRHELLHALSLEMEPWRSDLLAGLPKMLSALAQSRRAVPPQYANDPLHIFTDAAEAVLDSRPWDVPPPLRAYFASLVGGRG